MRSRLIEWIALFVAALALAGSAPYLLSRAWMAGRMLSVADDPPKIAALRLAPVLTSERVAAEIDAAVAAEDDDLARSFLELADARGVPVDPERRARVAALQSNVAYRAARAFAAGAATGEAESAAGLAGVLAADATGIGDLRDIAREGPACARSEPCDTLVLGLATVGLATSAATIASAGVAGPLRGGVTILKVARKLGRVSEPLVASLVRLVRAGVDSESVRTLVRAGGRLDLTAARGAARAAVRPEALRGLRGLGGDVYGVYAAAGPRGVLEVLGIARTTGEVARAERLAVTFGSRTRATLKLLGRAALVIGQELAALIRSALLAVFWACGLALFCRRLGISLGRALWRRTSPSRRSATGSVAAVGDDGLSLPPSPINDRRRMQAARHLLRSARHRAHLFVRPRP